MRPQQLHPGPPGPLGLDSAVFLAVLVLLFPPRAAGAEPPFQAPSGDRVVELKAPTGIHTHEFLGITSVRELSDGRVLVSDERANQILVVDFDSNRASTVGRTGGGPGEYRQVGRLWALGADSTLMADLGAPRWLLLDGASMVSTLGPDTAPLRVAGRGRLLGVSDAGQVVALVYAGHPITGGLAINDSMLVVRFDRSGGRLDTITRIQPEFHGPAGPPVPARVSRPAQSERRIYVVSIQARDQVAVFPDAWVAVARVEPYRVDWCSPTGPCFQGAPLATGSQRMTDREKRAYLEFMEKSTGWPPTDAVDQTAGWPDRVPPFVVPPRRRDFSAVLGDPAGRLLVQRVPTAVGQSGYYDVIARSGKLAGRIAIPLNQSIVGFGSASIYVSERDENGIERLVRHPWP